MSARKLLLLGMCAGLTLALLQLTVRPDGALQVGVIARVGSQELLETDYQRAVNGLRAERKKPLSAATRRRVLERMIDEYLLLEHARRLDLAFEVPELRKRTVDQVLQILRSQADALEPDEEDLEQFFARNRAYFSAAGDSSVGLAQLREQVQREWRRRAAEELLQSLLEELRSEFTVQVREDVL